MAAARPHGQLTGVKAVDRHRLRCDLWRRSSCGELPAPKFPCRPGDHLAFAVAADGVTLPPLTGAPIAVSSTILLSKADQGAPFPPDREAGAAACARPSHAGLNTSTVAMGPARVTGDGTWRSKGDACRSPPFPVRHRLAKPWIAGRQRPCRSEEVAGLPRVILGRARPQWQQGRQGGYQQPLPSRRLLSWARHSAVGGRSAGSSRRRPGPWCAQLTR